MGNSWTNYALFFHELTSDRSELIFEDDKVTVETIPLKHRVYTNGFLFREKPAERKLNIEAVQRYKIDKCYFQNIKNGKDVILDNGTSIPNLELSFDPRKPISYAFCRDTGFNPGIVPLISDIDVLYHESTFLETDAPLSKKTQHSTAKEAATIAKNANVGQLILGHFSTRYKSIELFKEEALEVFPQVQLADDGKVFEF